MLRDLEGLGSRGSAGSAFPALSAPHEDELMPVVLIGCPYTRLGNIRRALCKMESVGLRILNAESVIEISPEGFRTAEGNFPFAAIGSSFVRYPYDLIPPHSATYELREGIEFYRSIALLVDSVGINRLSETWALRNRAFSLSRLRDLGADVPDYWIVNGRPDFGEATVRAVKAIGNCFVSDTDQGLNKKQCAFVRIEQDDGETAAVFPASRMSESEAHRYADAFSFAFTQTPIEGVAEYRCYFVGGRYFVYERKQSEDFDKSSAGFLQTGYRLQPRTMIAVQRLAEAHKLQYLCFDLVVDPQDREFVIDLNPYGSFPPYESFQGPSDAIAQMLLAKAYPS